MEIKISKLPKHKYELDVVIPSHEMQEQYEKVLNAYSNATAIKGFRQGKAPTDLVIERVGKATLEKETLSHILESKFPQILQEAKLNPISEPKIQVVEFSLEKDLKLKITLEVFPEVLVKDYLKIKIKKDKPKEISEKQIEESINTLFENYKKNIEKEAAPLIYGSKGEVIKDSKVLDDEFAKSVGASDLEDLKKKVRVELEIQENYRVDNQFETRLIDEVIRKTKLEIPETLLDNEINRMMMRLNDQIQSMGVVFEDFLKAQNKTVDQLRESMRAPAEKSVTFELSLAKIAQLEGIEVNDEELKRNLHPGHENHTEEEKVQEENYLRYMIRQNKTLGILKKSALR